MRELLLSSTYFYIVITIAAYAIGVAVQKKTRLIILNPILISAALLILALTLLDIPNTTYQARCSLLSYLMTPATICLAIAFYQQFQNLKQHLGAVLVGVFTGTITSLGFIYLTSSAFGFDQTIIYSLLPKSITNAIAAGLVDEIGGITAVTTFAISITGIFCNVFGPHLCKLFRIREPIAQGVAFGTASHVLGTQKAAEMSELAGAISSFSLTIAGLLTVAVLSFAVQYI